VSNSLKVDVAKTIISAVIFTVTSYVLLRFVLEPHLPAPKKPGELDGLGCNCSQPWPYGRQG
jgi:hypothetical protein